MRTLARKIRPAWLLVGLGCLLAARGAARPEEGTLSEDFVRLLAHNLRSDREQVRSWSFVESSVLEKRSPDGTLRSRTTEVYEVFNRDGQVMRRPISIEPGGEEGDRMVDAQREEARFLPPPRKAGGDASKPMKDSPFQVDNLIRCFRFMPVGFETIGGRPARRVGFEPIDGCLDDGTRAGRLLQNLSGVLWIRDEDADVLRIEGKLRRPVSFGFGLLGRVDGFELLVEREPLSPGFYTMTHMNYRVRGTALLVRSFDITSVRDRSAFAPPARAEAGPASPR